MTYRCCNQYTGAVVKPERKIKYRVMSVYLSCSTKFLKKCQRLVSDHKLKKKAKHNLAIYLRWW